MAYNRESITGSKDRTYKRKKGPHDVYVSTDNFKKILKRVKSKPLNKLWRRDYMMFVLMGNLGLRVGEVAICEPKHFKGLGMDPALAEPPCLKKRDKKKRGYKKWIPQTDMTKNVFVHPKVAKVIMTYIEEEVYRNDKYIFVGTQGDGHISPRQIRVVFNSYVKACNIVENYTTHSLRHMVGTIIASETKDPAFVRDQLGHAVISNSLGTTNDYIHTNLDRINEYLKLVGYFL